MDALRYGLAVVLVVLVPMVLAFWLVIHAGSAHWKRRRPAVAYGAAGFAMAATGALTFWSRDVLIGRDLGLNLLLFGAGLVVYVLSLGLARPVRRYLTFRTFAGVPQIANQSTTLLDRGPYAVVRHPRYLMVLIGMIGWALMAHYTTAYAVGLLCAAGLVLVAYLEERELVARFGDSYLNYRRTVPMLLPRIGAIPQFWQQDDA